jgi:hypothetical protein
MKITPAQTLAAQAIISIIAFIGLLALTVYGVIYHDASVIPYAVGGMAVIYTHWAPSPAQQSTITALLQQLIPILTALAQTQQVSSTAAELPKQP